MEIFCEVLSGDKLVKEEESRTGENLQHFNYMFGCGFL